jgi:hypothetical protein
VVNASLRWLNNVSGVYLVQVSLLLIGQQGLGHFYLFFFWWQDAAPFGTFLRVSDLASHWLEDCANCTPTPEENDKYRVPVQCQPLLVQYKQQDNSLLSVHNYTPIVISGNDKNKQLTLLSQCKLALTGRNKLFAS